MHHRVGRYRRGANANLLERLRRTGCGRIESAILEFLIGTARWVTLNYNDTTHSLVNRAGVQCNAANHATNEDPGRNRAG